MNQKTFVKLIIANILLGLLFIGGIFFSAFITKTETGIILGGLITVILIAFLMAMVYPIVFKDYIEEFWKKQEEKECQEKEEAENPQKLKQRL